MRCEVLEYHSLQSEYLSLPVLPYMYILHKHTIIGRVDLELLKNVELLIQDNISNHHLVLPSQNFMQRMDIKKGKEQVHASSKHAILTSNHQPNENQRYQVNQIGKQAYNNYDNTCRFWVIGIALFKVLDMDFCHLPNSILPIKYYCHALWQEYQSSTAGRVTCELVSKMMTEFKRDCGLISELLGEKVVSTCPHSNCCLLMEMENSVHLTALTLTSIHPFIMISLSCNAEPFFYSDLGSRTITDGN